MRLVSPALTLKPVTSSAGSDQQGLSIGQLAERTGVRPTTLRMWESRYGFPRPGRLESGRRLYDLRDAENVLDVLRLRDGGMRLGTAVATVVQRGDGAPAVVGTSVYAELRRRHPALVPHRLRKTTLRGLSWAIEDEIRASTTSGFLFAAFQEQRFYEPARPRWLQLAGFATTAFVFAEFDQPGVEAGLVSVPISADAPLRSEWVVVCDGPDLSVALSAWELPRQRQVSDRRRVFESMWTNDPTAVRDAARVCAHVAEQASAPGAVDTVRRLGAPPAAAVVDHAAIALYNRIVAYVDRETD